MSDLSDFFDAVVVDEYPEGPDKVVHLKENAGSEYELVFPPQGDVYSREVRR